MFPLYTVARHFQYKKPVEECIPTSQHPELRVMLLLGDGVLCVLDGADAAIRSGGNMLSMFIRMNLIAWFRFISLVLKEVCIRLGIKDAMQKQLEAFRRVNQAIVLYLNELERIDMEAYKKEAEQYSIYCRLMQNTSSEAELNKILLFSYQELEIHKPWKGDFDEFMEIHPII